MFINIKSEYSKQDILRRLNFMIPIGLVDFDYKNDEIVYIEIKESLGRKFFDICIECDYTYEQFVKKFCFSNNLELVTLLNLLNIKRWYFDIDKKGVFLGKSSEENEKSFPRWINNL